MPPRKQTGMPGKSKRTVTEPRAPAEKRELKSKPVRDTGSKAERKAAPPARGRTTKRGRT